MPSRANNLEAWWNLGSVSLSLPTMTLRPDRRFAVALMLAATLSGCAHTNTGFSSTGSSVPRDRAVLPLTRVRLYESGVGYFERRGRLEPTRSALPIPAGHLDDALKTLVLLESDSPLSGVTFPSRLSPAVARARAGLPANQEAPLSYDRLLVALRGEPVELQIARGDKFSVVRGRVVDVVAVAPSHPSYDHGSPNRTIPKGEEEPAHERLHVLLLSPDGEILRVDASQLRAVRPLDEAVAHRLNAAMTAHLSTRSNQRQMLDLVGEERDIALAYLAEAPIWRASYRLRMEGEGPAQSQLQAWALVHNDTDEAWHDVQVELIHGRPTSFLFPVTAPRYERRSLQTPEDELSSVPQLSTTTPDALWGDFSDYEGEMVGRVGSEGVIGLGSVGFGGGGGGYGEGTGGLGRVGLAERPQSSGSDLLWVGDLSAHAKRVEKPKQTNPVFALATPLDLEPQHSAMVPFLDLPLDAVPVVWFRDFHATAERAVGINNTTPHTLPAGPLAVFGGGGFLGEAMLGTLHPGGRQFAQIGDEPDTTIEAGPTRVEDTVVHVDFREGQLREHSRRISTTRLAFGNQTGASQTAYVALPIVTNASVEGADDLDFDTTSATPFSVFRLPLGKSDERVLVCHEAIRTGTPIGDLTTEILERWIDMTTVPTQEREVLRASLAPLQAWHAVREQISETHAQVATVHEELTRLREDLKELRSEGAASAHGPLMQRIFEREDLVAQLGRRIDELGKASAQRQTELEAVLSGLEAFREAILETRKATAAAAG